MCMNNFSDCMSLSNVMSECIILNDWIRDTCTCTCTRIVTCKCNGHMTLTCGWPKFSPNLSTMGYNWAMIASTVGLLFESTTRQTPKKRIIIYFAALIWSFSSLQTMDYSPMFERENQPKTLQHKIPLKILWNEVYITTEFGGHSLFNFEDFSLLFGFNIMDYPPQH